MRGYPILFEVYAPMWGDWQEVIDKKALDGVDLSDLRLLVNHDTGKLLARAGINLKASIDEIGLFIEAELPDTTLAADTWELVNREIMDGMSFAFSADKWETDSEKKVDRIMHFREVWEVSIVTFPAYPQTVVIADNGEEPDMDPNAGKADLLAKIISTI